MPTGYKGGSNNPELSASWLVRGPDGVVGSEARRVCLKALRYHDGNITRAARDLKVGRSTLLRWISTDEVLKLGLEVVRQDVARARAEADANGLEPD